MATNDELIARAAKARDALPCAMSVFETTLAVVAAMDDLVAALRAADQRIAELERDRERLDWLDPAEITLTLYGRDKTEKRSAREVIDAAMGGEAQTHD